MTEPDPDTWQDALNRRLRTFIRTSPLHKLATSRRPEPLFESQDLRALALRALDLTIERMGLGFGITQVELHEELQPLIRACYPEATSEETSTVTDIVLDGLLNERARRQAFCEPYLFLEDEAPQRRSLQFHLLREVPAPDGTIVLKATTEAINLYAGMLEYPVEDAQIAEAAVLKSQLRRGRIDEALRTAKRARIRSIEYEQKILSLLQRVRRDVQQVDWIEEVLGLLAAARDHLESHLEREHETLSSVRSRLEKLEIGDPGKLVALKATLEECYQRHVQLHTKLIDANRQWLDEQDRQAFRPRSLDPLPDLEAEILQPLLLLRTGELAAKTNWLLTRLQPISVPHVLRLTSLVDMLLQPPRAAENLVADITHAELEHIGDPLIHFSTADRAAADDILRVFLNDPKQPRRRLSALLTFARDQGRSRMVCHYLVLHVLGAYEPAEHRAIEVLPTHEVLDDPDFYGDDLFLRRTV